MSVNFVQAQGGIPLIKGPVPERKFPLHQYCVVHYFLTQVPTRPFLLNHHFSVMHMLLHLPFLGLALFSSSAFAATIPQGTSLTTPTNPLQSNTSFDAVSSAFVCSINTASHRILPSFADCAGALRSVPLDPSIGTFYNSGSGDFQLPYFTSHKTCTVIVELRSTYDKVRSSWLAVHAAAMELNTACQDVRTAPGLGIGYTYIDELRSMKITLKGPQRTLGGGENATETA